MSGAVTLLWTALLAWQEEPLRAAWGSVRVIDPALAVSTPERRVAEALFAGLASAKSEVAGEVVTFHLPEIAWSDGRAVTASDYRFAWLRCLTPSTGSPWAFSFRHIRQARAYTDSLRLADLLLAYDTEGPTGRKEIGALALAVASPRHAASLRKAAAQEADEEVKADLQQALEAAARRADVTEASVGIEAPEARTLRVTLERPAPGFVERASTLPFAPVPEHVVRANRDRWTQPQHLVTCGPYRLEKWTRDEMVLVRAGASEGPPRILLRMLDRPAEAWPLYERGELDWLDRPLVPPERLESLRESGELRTAAIGPAICLRINAARDPFSKAPVRRAIAQAIDRARLVKSAWPGAEERTSMTGGDGCSAPARDLAAALTALVAESPDLSKFPRINFLYWKGFEAEAVAQALKEQLEENLAVRIRVDAREWPAYLQALETGEYDVALVAWVPEPGDPLGFLDLVTGGREKGEATLLNEAWLVPLLRGGDFVAAKPHVQVLPGWNLNRVRVKR
ncbi:MAG: hypothetical protein HY716_14605 [Planctomycetes bacterium]|nr:hypothetical protein [Planctomycetota bacterium]